MKIRTFIIVLFLLLFTRIVFSQDDNASHEDLRSKKARIDAEKKIIQNSRAEMVDLIKINDPKSVKSIFETLKKYDDSLTMAMYLTERMLLEIYVEDYKSFIETLNNKGELNNTKFNFNTKIAPPKDDLYATLMANLLNKYENTLQKINEAALNDENMFFADLGYRFVLIELNKKEFTADVLQQYQDSFNRHSEMFVKSYPTSRFNSFIETNIYHKTRLRNFGWGVEMFIGGGGFTGNLSDKFKNYFTLGLGMNFTFKRIFFRAGYYLGLGGGFNQNFNYKGIQVKANDNATYINPEFEIGYTLSKPKLLTFTPTVGYTVVWANHDVSKYNTNPNDKEYDITIAPMVLLGCNIDINFYFVNKKGYSTYTGRYYGPSQGTATIRIKPYIGISANNAISGSIIGIHTGWSCNYRRMKRVHLEY